jgi:hypothetical protein
MCLTAPGIVARRVELSVDVSKTGAKIDRNIFGLFACPFTDGCELRLLVTVKEKDHGRPILVVYTGNRSLRITGTEAKTWT